MTTSTTISGARPADAVGAVEAPVASGAPGTARNRPTLFRPRSAAWWLYCLALGLGWTAVLLAFGGPAKEAMPALFQGLPLLLGTGLGTGALVLLVADRYRSRQPWPMLAGALLGATAVPAVAIHGNDWISRSLPSFLPEGVASDWSTALSGPFTEEWAKMLCMALVVVLAAGAVRRPMQGFLVGAATGLGFQILENITYFLNAGLENPESTLAGGITATIARAVTGLTTHWLMTGLAGIGVVVLMDRSRGSLLRRGLGFAAFFLGGLALHFWWNSPAPDGIAGTMLLVKMGVALLILAVVLRWLWAQERAALEPADRSVSDEVLASRYATAPELVRAAVGTRKQRRAARRNAKADAGSKRRRAAVRALKRDWKDYLAILQPLTDRTPSA